MGDAAGHLLERGVRGKGQRSAASSRRTAQQVGLAVGVAAVVFVGAARASGLLADVVASAPAAVSGYALTFTVTAVVLLGTEVLVRADALGRGAQDTFGAGA